MAAKKIHEKILDEALKEQIDVDKFSNGLSRKVAILLERVQNEVIGALAKIDPTAPSMTKWKQARLEQLNKEISKIVNSHYREIKKTVKRDIRAAATAQASNVAAAYNVAVGAELMKVVLDGNTIKNITENVMIDGNIIGGWWNNQSQRTKQRLAAVIAEGTNAIQIGMVQGESVGEIISRIRGTKLTPGIMSVTKREAAALVRTSVMQVSGAVRTETFKANSDVVKGIRIVATLDDRTTPLCRALDGLEYDLEGNPIGHDRPYPKSGGPPFHWNCRTTIVPITKSWKELAGENSPLSQSQLSEMGKIPAGVKDTINGPIPVDMTYNDWLLTLSAKQQKDILGKARWQLWKDNRLTVRDLVDNSGQVLTIKQLKEKFAHVAKPATIAATEQQVPVETEHVETEEVYDEKKAFARGEIVAEKERPRDSMNVTYKAEIGGDGQGLLKKLSDEAASVERQGFRCFERILDYEMCPTVYREVLTSDIAEFLGYSFVPKTVMKKTLDGKGYGSCQYWVDDLTPDFSLLTSKAETIWQTVRPQANTIPVNLPAFKEQVINPILSHPDIEKAASEFSDMIVFDRLIGNIDRHIGNIGFSPSNNKVFLIDNGLTFGFAPQNGWNGDFLDNAGRSAISAFVRTWHSEAKAAFWKKIKELCLEKSKEVYKLLYNNKEEVDKMMKARFLTQREISAFWSRAEKLEMNLSEEYF